MGEHATAVDVSGRDKLKINESVYKRVSEIVGRVYHDLYPDLPENFVMWPVQEMDTFVETVCRYYDKLVTEAGGDGDLLKIGSLLHWLEYRIWQELDGNEDEAAEANSLRDQLIGEQTKRGVSAVEISQAFNIKRVAVERIISRLTGSGEEMRKAV